MPTYEYRCKACGHEFEAVQSFSDEPLGECPTCAGPLRKVFGNVGISFKGSGFYKTDSQGAASGASSATAGSEGSSSTTDSSASESGSSGSSGSSDSGSSSSAGSTSGGGSSSESSSTTTPAST
jgi:putative FmdB family regulatory protein